MGLCALRARLEQSDQRGWIKTVELPLVRADRFLVRAASQCGETSAVVARGLIYVVGIWTVEYATGWSLKRAFSCCPWDYSKLSPSPARIDKLGPVSTLVRLRFCAGISARQT